MSSRPLRKLGVRAEVLGLAGDGGGEGLTLPRPGPRDPAAHPGPAWVCPSLGSWSLGGVTGFRPGSWSQVQLAGWCGLQLAGASPLPQLLVWGVAQPSPLPFWARLLISCFAISV